MVGEIDMLMKILRVLTLIYIPILCVFCVVWIMRHEPFEEIVRTCLAVIVSTILIVGWFSLLKL